MMKQKSLIILFIGLIVNGCSGCFESNDYHATIATGNSYYQECQCTEPDHDVNHLIWLDNNNKIITAGPGTDSNVFVERLGDSVNLHIKSVSTPMSGTFKCITEYKGLEYVQKYNIEVYDPLFFINTDENQSIVEGLDSRINCEPRGNKPIIRWHKMDDEQVEIQNSEKYEITPEGLIVKNVTINDGGTYKCTALVIITGEEVDRFIKTEVMTIPVIKEIKAIPQTTVIAGNSLSIECIAEGMPHPEYIWTKITDLEKTEARNHTWQQLVNTINFHEIKADDHGVYECTAQNFAGNDTKSISIEVLLQPQIHGFENVTFVEGTTIEIACNATGKPEPNVTVFIKRQDINDGSYSYEMLLTKTIVVNRTDEGFYSCDATNEVAKVSKELYMTVLHKPYFDQNVEAVWGWNEKTINLSCAHHSNPPATITWSFQGNYVTTQEQVEINKQLIEMLNKVPEHYLTVTIDKNFSYGIYECTAQNIHGVSTKLIYIKEGFVPPVIAYASILETTATSATFIIDGPEIIHGPPTIGFTAEYDEESNYNITNIHVNRTWALDRPYKLEKLKPNTTYYIKFAALNEIGVGEWSDTLEFDTLEKSVPESPAWDVNEALLTNKVVKWTEPEDNGDPIDYYAIRYCPIQDPMDESLCKEERIDPNTELSFDKLQSNKTYYLELIAHNAQGNSTASNITVDTLARQEEHILSAGVIIGIAIVIVIVCLVLLDVLLFLWKRQGIIASCCCKKKDKKSSELQARDRKGLLKENSESADNTLKRTEKGHKEYEYNKTTGVITGKHSAV